MNLAVAPGATAHRIYALAGGRGGGGLYRSDDNGATWTMGTNRLASASGHIYADPKNPDVVYTMGTSMYRSMDAGRTLVSVKGAPGGDDNRSLWIDPTNPQRMIIGADQGPTITVNGGASWTPWYVVQNGEHYFVTADDQFPYWIYAAQQDSGTVAIKSRSDYGAIRPNDWYPVSGYEQGHIFADPFNPRYVYSHGGGEDVALLVPADGIPVVRTNRAVVAAALDRDRAAVLLRGVNPVRELIVDRHEIVFAVLDDDQFPYWIYAAQQDSGTVAIKEPQRLRRDSSERLVSRQRVTSRATSSPTRSIRGTFYSHGGEDVARAHPLTGYGHFRQSRRSPLRLLIARPVAAVLLRGA